MGDVINQPLRLAVYGFDDRSRETLRLAFEGPGRGCGVLVDEGSANAGIFNMDSVNAQELWADYRNRFPKRPTIIMAIKDPEVSDSVYVAKPVRIDAMIKAVDQAKSMLGMAVETTAKVANGADSMVGNVSVSHPAVNQVPDTLVAEKRPKPAAPIERKPRDSVTQEQPVVSTSVLPPVPEKRAPVAAPPSTKVDLKPDPSKRRVDTFYDPQEFVQSQVQDALTQANKKYVAVQLNIQNGEESLHSITFLPGVKRVLTTLSDEQLKHLCSTPLTLLECTSKKYKGDETFSMIRKVTDEKSGQSLDVFLWKVALWTSLGRLPVGINLTAPVKLRHWPNLTRFYPIPNAMRIATLIIDQPRPLPLIIKVLNLPQTHVFAFYSAAYAIGLIGDKADVAASQAAAEMATPQKHKHHTLFGRILKRLRGGGGE